MAFPTSTKYLIMGAGPWVKQIWDMLGLPAAITIKGRDGMLHENVAMGTFWSLQEGTLGVDPMLQRTNDGRMPPVIHVDTDATLYSDADRSVITDRIWGIYYKPDFNFGGVQGGAMPFKVKADPAQVNIDPYGPASPDFVVGGDCARMWCPPRPAPRALHPLPLPANAAHVDCSYRLLGSGRIAGTFMATTMTYGGGCR